MLELDQVAIARVWVLGCWVSGLGLKPANNVCT